MAAKYGPKEKARTAIVSLIVGMVAGGAYVLPGHVTLPILCVFVYVCGIMDGRSGGWGARAVETALTVRTKVTAAVRGPQGGQS